MPQGILAGVEYSERRLVAERAIAERFPDAYLGDLPSGEQVWTSPAAVSHVTDFEILVTKDKRAGLFFAGFLLVSGMRVYAPLDFAGSYWSVMDHLREKHADIYQKLSLLAAGTKQCCQKG